MKRIAAAGVCILGMMLPGTAEGCSEFQEHFIYHAYSIYDLAVNPSPQKPELSIQLYTEDFEKVSSLDEIGDSLMMEWESWAGYPVKLKDLKLLLEDASTFSLETAYQEVNNGTVNSPSAILMNAFLSELSPEKACQFLDYALTLKRVQSARKSYGWYSGEPDEQNSDLFQQELESKASQEKNRFLRQRYAWLAMRYASQFQDYRETIRIFRKYFSTPGTSLLYGCARDKYAGALFQQDRYAEALYHFSRVFARYPQLRNMSLQSMKRVKKVQFWEDAAQYCRNERERDDLFLARTLASAMPAVMQMETLCAAPRLHPLTEDAFIHQILTLEHQMLPVYEPYSRYADREDPRYPAFCRPLGADGQSEAARLARLLEQMQSSGRIARSRRMQTAGAWLFFLGGDYPRALDRLHRLRKTYVSFHEEAQLIRMEIATTLCSLPHIDAAAEKRIFNLFEPLMYMNHDLYSDTETLLLDGLAWHYKRQGEIGKEFLCHQNAFQAENITNERLLLSLLAFFKKPEKNALESYLLDRNNLTPNHLLETAGTYYLFRNQPEKALKYLHRLPDDYESIGWAIPGDPFQPQYAKGHKPNQPATAFRFNKCTLAQEWLNLLPAKHESKNTRAEKLLQTGNLLLNTSQYGFAPDARDMHFSSSVDEDYPDDNPGNSWHRFMKRYFGEDHEDLRPALHYFRQARALSSDPEIQAEAQFGILHCLYIQKAYAKEKTAAWAQTRQHLLQHYAETAALERMVSECGTLRQAWFSGPESCTVP